MKRWLPMWTILAVAGILIGWQPALSQTCASDDPSSPVGLTPTLVSGNPALCAGGFRLDPPVSGTYNLDAFGNTITVTISSGTCGQVFSWSASGNVIIDKVIAKGGPNANSYDYTGLNPRPTSDGNLHSPLTSSGKYADLSHIDFCYHYRLTIGKTATPKFTRTFDWTIEKNCLGDESLTLATGQTFSYPFSWKVSNSSTDSDWKVEGSITIANNTPLSATITSVDDQLTGGVAATVDCGISFPYILASGASLTCTYTANLAGAVNGTNTVTVVTSTPLVEGGMATANYAFGNPTTLVDECVAVADNCNSGTTEVCYTAAPFTKNYNCEIGPYAECGNYSYTNTASFTTNDRGNTGNASCTVTIEVPCQQGCTLTPGYWKTHSEFGPAPYDDNWANLPNGASTPFFLSGKSYYGALWTAPAGNAYYILAHAYIAAQLNFLNGADPSAAQAAFDAATNLFQTYTPNQIAALRGNNPVRRQFVDLASTLDDYNNGRIGPGHCDEETNRKTGAANDGLDSATPELRKHIPDSYNLEQNYPNPFNPSTTFTFDLPQEGEVKLTIFSLSGQEVATVVQGFFNAGRHQVNWRAPQELSSDVYIFRLQAGKQVIVKKMLLIK